MTEYGDFCTVWMGLNVLFIVFYKDHELQLQDLDNLWLKKTRWVQPASVLDLVSFCRRGKRNGLNTNAPLQAPLARGLILMLWNLKEGRLNTLPWHLPLVSDVVFSERFSGSLSRYILNETGQISPTHLRLCLSRIFWCWSRRLKIANNLPDSTEGSVRHGTTIFLITSMTSAYSPRYHQAWITTIF